MTLVEGAYCPVVRQRCKRWLDDPRVPYARCAVFSEPTQCLAERVTMKFCIDRYEYTPAGERLPQNYASLSKAQKLCQRLGRRACLESEWNFACEGERMLPYPYGFTRQPVCNQDRYDLYEPGQHRRVLRDLREPAARPSDCRSPFDVYDMVGNLDEPVLRDGAGPPFGTALKGGWWMPARNRCRPATTSHDQNYEGIQVGIRCCADLPSP